MARASREPGGGSFFLGRSLDMTSLKRAIAGFDERGFVC